MNKENIVVIEEFVNPLYRGSHRYYTGTPINDNKIEEEKKKRERLLQGYLKTKRHCSEKGKLIFSENVNDLDDDERKHSPSNLAYRKIEIYHLENGITTFIRKREHINRRHRTESYQGELEINSFDKGALEDFVEELVEITGLPIEIECYGRKGAGWTKISKDTFKDL